MERRRSSNTLLTPTAAHRNVAFRGLVAGVLIIIAIVLGVTAISSAEHVKDVWAEFPQLLIALGCMFVAMLLVPNPDA